jgi:hypothetical protein
MSLRSIFNVACIGRLMSHGMPSLHTFSSFSVTPQRRPPSAYKRPAYLDDILTDVPRHHAAAPSGLQATVQRRVLDVLAQQIMLGGLALSSAAWALRRCTRFCRHQVIPYSSAGRRHSRCSVASAGPPFPTLLRNRERPHHLGTCRKEAIRR